MKILAPVSETEEVPALAHAGADELFCGLFPSGWYERWGRAGWPNRRGPGPANIEELETLGRLADAVHAQRDQSGEPLPLFVAMNQQYYSDEQAEFLLQQAQQIASMGAADALIVTDPGFMRLLHRELPDLPLFASTVSVALNSEAALFLGELGCERVILSRHLHLEELRQFQEALPQMQLEVFLLNDNCYFEEGFCSTAHALPGFGVYCMTPWEFEVELDGKGPIKDPAERERWDFLIDEHIELQRSLSHRGYGKGSAALPLGPCGLCAIPELIDMGIHSGKIVGREAGLYRKLRSVQAVRFVRDNYLEGKDAGATKQQALDLRGDPKGCADGFFCYYRSARDRGLVELPSRPKGPRPVRRKDRS
ncbi:MAG: peptidase U32 [Rickettsiales bacterium]|nr:peptidase U32 [Rickettsiales bacterium]